MKEKKSKPLSLEQKIDYIVKNRAVYALLHRRAGWAFQFYTGPHDLEGQVPFDWQTYLRVDRYYDTLREAVDAEFAKFDNRNGELWKSSASPRKSQRG